MDPGLATFLGGATAGFVGLTSALFSFLALRSQIKTTTSEKEKDRDYQILLATIPKLLRALEEIWALLYTIQINRRITDEQVQNYIAATLWLPSELRGSSLELIRQFIESPDDISSYIGSVQDQVVAYSQKLRSIIEEDRNG